MEEVADSVSEPEDPSEIRDALVKMEGLLEDSMAAFVKARNDLEGLQPPEEAESLHRDLLDFYAEAERVYGEFNLFVSYCQELMSAMTRGYAELKDSLAMGMTSEEVAVRALNSLEDYYSTSLKELEAVEQPEGLGNFHRRFLEAWSELAPIITDLRAALLSRDAGKLSSVESSLGEWQNDMALLAVELESRFREIGEELTELVDEGRSWKMSCWSFEGASGDVGDRIVTGRAIGRHGPRERGIRMGDAVIFEATKAHRFLLRRERG